MAVSKHRTKISPARRLSIFQRDDYTCRGCGDQYPPLPDGRPSLRTIPTTKGHPSFPWDTYYGLEIDHVHPVSLGGTNDVDNLQALCTPCNARKGAKV